MRSVEVGQEIFICEVNLIPTENPAVEKATISKVNGTSFYVNDLQNVELPFRFSRTHWDSRKGEEVIALAYETLDEYQMEQHDQNWIKNRLKEVLGYLSDESFNDIALILEDTSLSIDGDIQSINTGMSEVKGGLKNKESLDAWVDKLSLLHSKILLRSLLPRTRKY